MDDLEYRNRLVRREKILKSWTIKDIKIRCRSYINELLNKNGDDIDFELCRKLSLKRLRIIANFLADCMCVLAPGYNTGTKQRFDNINSAFFWMNGIKPLEYEHHMRELRLGLLVKRLIEYC